MGGTITKSRKVVAISLTLFLVILVIAAYTVWTSRSSQEPFPPSGGKVFTERVLVDVPFFLQNDERWAEDEIGISGSRMGAEGCAVASVAMLLKYYGIVTDPMDLNNRLSHNQGYTDRGWIYWNKISELTSGKVQLTYVGTGSYEIIDNNVRNKNPVITKIFINKVIPHWVLIVGKEGREYLINDPLASDKKVGKLSKYNSDIYGIRIYSAH